MFTRDRGAHKTRPLEVSLEGDNDMNSNTIATQLRSMPAASISAMSNSSIASLSASDLQTLTATQVKSFTSEQIFAIQPETFSELTSIFKMFSSQQVASISTANISSLKPLQLWMLTGDKIAAMTVEQINALRVDTFASFGAQRIKYLTPSQISALSKAQVNTLWKGKLACMSGEQIAAIKPDDLASLGAHRIGMLTDTQLSALTTSQIYALTAKEISAVSNIGALSARQISYINYDAINQLGGAFLSKIDPTFFSFDQYGVMNSSTIANLSTAFFSKIPNSDLVSILPSEISGITIAQLQALTDAQKLEFNSKQISAMTSDQQNIINQVNSYIVDAARATGSGVFTYQNALTMLQDAASTDMTQQKFSQLQGLDQKLQDVYTAAYNGLDDAILTTPAVKLFFDSVVSGSPENNAYFGGNSQSTPLGNLTATSTQSQFKALINKWFNGTDLPSIQTDAAGDVLPTKYQASSLSLFGPTDAPTMGDVVQGTVQDSALLAGIAETALQDPGYLQRLFTDNGNGTYTIELPAIFGSTYTTVNKQLPVAQSSGAVATANSSTGEWVALLEKAAAQNTLNIGISAGTGTDALANTYASLTLQANSDDLFSLYAGGQIFTSQYFGEETQNQVDLQLSQANNLFTTGHAAIFQRGNEYYAVTGINASGGSINVYDTSTGKQTSITISSNLSVGDVLYTADMGRAS